MGWSSTSWNSENNGWSARPLPAGGGEEGTTTWNPADKNSSISLTNGNKTAVDTGDTAFVSLRSVASRASGKFYCEILVDAAANVGTVVVGVANSVASLDTFIGADLNGGGWSGTGGAFGAFASATPETWAVGDTLCIAVDLTARTFWLRKNGNDWFNDPSINPVTGVGGASLPITGDCFVAATMNAPGDAFTANFGATSYVFGAPAGFENW